MASRLRIPVPFFSRLLLALPLVMAGVVACDDPVAPERADIDDVGMLIDAPEWSQAEDSFDVVVRLHNLDETRRTGALSVSLAYGMGFDPNDHIELDEQDVAHLSAGDSTEVTFRIAIPAAQAAFGRPVELLLCVHDRDEESAWYCNTDAMMIGPDIATSCDPTVLTLPASGSIADHRCTIGSELAGVFALDAEADHLYEIGISGASSYHIQVYDSSGADVFTIGTLADGSTFLAPATGRFHIVFRHLTMDESWTFDVHDAGPM